MKYLVTGGAGFIGSNFIAYLLEKYPGCQVTNLDKLTYAGNRDNLTKYETDKRYRFIKGDICDRPTVEKAMKGVDVVVHFAAESHVDRSITGPAVFVQTNVVGTQVLLDVAREQKIKRFHHVSTDEVFGSLSLDDKTQKFNEATPYRPHSPYSASKAASDHLVRAYHDTFGLPITISNCSNNYGPFHFPEKLIPLFITNAIEKKPLPIYGAGVAVRDYLYVEDHCRAIDVIINKGRLGETYCVGGDSGKNTLEVAALILKAFKLSDDAIAHVEDRLGHDMRYAIDHTKISQELGWQPSVTFEDGMKLTIDWYRQHPKWWQKIKSRAAVV